MVLTDWKTIGTAGATIDGREILEQDLIDAAETYDKDEYIAVINSDHELYWYGNFGHVEDVRIGKDSKDRVILEARLAPNRRLIEKNLNGQGMFTSMELWPNCFDSGKTYLTGLAVTDQPASAGTSMLKMFSRAKQSGSGENADIKLMKEFLSLPLDELNASDSETNPSDEQKIFSKLMRFLKSESPNQNHEPELKPNDKDGQEMTKEQFDALTAHNEKMLGVLSDVSKKLAKQELIEPVSEPDGSEENELSALEAKVNSLDEKLTTINETFKSLLKEKPGTTPASNEGVEEADFI